MIGAPVLGISTRLELRGRNVGTGHEKAVPDATRGERGHVGGSLCTRSGQRAEQRVVRQAFPVTISDLEPDKLGQPFRPAIFEIRDSNRPLSFFNIATIRLQHRQVRRHAVGF